MTELRKILITGSRYWTDFDAIRVVISDQAERAAKHKQALLVIHGDCPTGADRIAEDICAGNGIYTARVAARWERWGKTAGPLRNRVMVQMEPCLAFAFSSDLARSPGTRDCLRQLRAAKIDVIIIGSSERPEKELEW